MQNLPICQQCASGSAATRFLNQFSMASHKKRKNWSLSGSANKGIWAHQSKCRPCRCVMNSSLLKPSPLQRTPSHCGVRIIANEWKCAWKPRTAQTQNMIHFAGPREGLVTGRREQHRTRRRMEKIEYTAARWMSEVFAEKEEILTEWGESSQYELICGMRGEKDLRQRDGDEWDGPFRRCDVFSLALPRKKPDLQLLPHTHLKNRDIYPAKVSTAIVCFCTKGMCCSVCEDWGSGGSTSQWSVKSLIIRLSACSSAALQPSDLQTQTVSWTRSDVDEYQGSTLPYLAHLHTY